jgi:DNA repair exonuclease SbcCD nuclease subunit
MRLRMLHLADVRLGADHRYAGERADRRRRDVEESFKAAADYALDRASEIDLVLVTGDLFDARRPDADAFALARGVFARLAAGGVGTVVLPGFRDALAPECVWRSEKFAGATVLTASAPSEPVVVDVRGSPVHLYGVAYRPGRTPLPFAGFARTDAPGFHVGLLHGMVEDHPERATRPAAWTIPLAALEASGLDYVALGGAHGGGEYRFARGLAAYAGALEGSDFAPGDEGPHGFVVVELTEDGATLERRDVARGVVVDGTIDLGAESVRDAESLRAALLSRAGERVVARFTLRGVREFLCDFDELAASVADRFRVLALRDASSFEDSLLVRRIAAEGTIRGFFVRKALKRLATLREKLPHRRDAAVAEREVRVAERALTLGLSQFVEADAAAPAAASPRAATAAEPARPAARIGRVPPKSAEKPRAADEIVLEEGA